MPALPPMPNVFKILVQGNASELQEFIWQNILHFSWSGTTPTVAACSTFADEVQLAWSQHVAPLCPSSTVQNVVVVTDMTSNTAAQADNLTINHGTRTGSELPANAAMLISYPIGVRYRGGHPRQYLLAGVQGDMADAANWTSGFVTAVTSGWQAFLEAILATSSGGTALGSFGIVSYYSVNVNPVPPHKRTTPVFEPITITGAVANQEMASQRRRIGRSRR